MPPRRSKRIRSETTKASDSRGTSGPYGVMDDCSSKTASNHLERQATIRDNCIIFTCHMHRRYSTSHSSGPKHGLHVSNAKNKQKLQKSSILIWTDQYTALLSFLHYTIIPGSDLSKYKIFNLSLISNPKNLCDFS